MEELLKRSPTLPRTYQTTTVNDGNCRRKATMNSNLGFEAKNTIGENILRTNKQIQPADAKKPAAEISNNANQNDVVEHYLRLVLNQKLDNQTTGLNIAGNLQKLPQATVAHHQLQATVAHKSLAAGYQNGVTPLTSSNLVDNSRAIPAASYSSASPAASYSSTQISRSWITSRNIQTTTFPSCATVMLTRVDICFD
ncbi:hypothetical protein F511_36621 [Dorcoceras hygrometricum]|uniref:Uncharacterized protein n=1 Tax=Dorcoceras hygrometricum TaxID=472368 RepID=A0A2Z7BFE9_9LAMI|nr:hypothetical protein F511_36621 [Dorcoceras hygrometricum]